MNLKFLGRSGCLCNVLAEVCVLCVCVSWLLGGERAQDLWNSLREHFRTNPCMMTDARSTSSVVRFGLLLACLSLVYVCFASPSDQMAASKEDRKVLTPHAIKAYIFWTSMATNQLARYPAERHWR